MTIGQRVYFRLTLALLRIACWMGVRDFSILTGQGLQHYVRLKPAEDERGPFYCEQVQIAPKSWMFKRRYTSQ